MQFLEKLNKISSFLLLVLVGAFLLPPLLTHEDTMSISYAEAQDIVQFVTPTPVWEYFTELKPDLEDSVQLDYAMPMSLELNNGDAFLQDVNGDGLADLIRGSGPESFVFLNNGKGFDITYYCALQGAWPYTYKGHCAK